MSRTTLSVIVVSRHRSAALTRCLLGLSQQDYPMTEVIVVADPKGLSAVTAQGFGVKHVPFDQANISAARNAGLAVAAGEVVAFIDDDAVPEPTWASRLIAPFADGAVVAATGFVRGRNGISFQWTASEVDTTAQDHPLLVPADQTSLHRGTAQRAVKTQGTNCAFRNADLRAIGGFDPAYRFYLDEADVNLRLAGRGLTAVVPLAQVHHGFAASARRRPDRVPVSLFDIGASVAVFLRRHAPERIAGGQIAQAGGWLLAEQRQRLLGHMVAGRLEPREVGHLLAGLSEGWADGMTRRLDALPPIPASTAPFLPLAGLGPRQGYVIAGRSWQRRRLVAKARKAVAKGGVVTLLIFAPGVRRHWHRFESEGFWLQTGGLWGKSERDSLPTFGRLTQRVQYEVARLSWIRPMGP